MQLINSQVRQAQRQIGFQIYNWGFASNKNSSYFLSIIILISQNKHHEHVTQEEVGNLAPFRMP